MKCRATFLIRNRAVVRAATTRKSGETSTKFLRIHPRMHLNLDGKILKPFSCIDIERVRKYDPAFPR